MSLCPRCLAENPPNAKFCMACAAPLEAQGPATAEERKVVTVLFCDLVGFTALADKADPEDVKATLRPYHSRLLEDIQRFSGTVEKFIGDAVMAVFGAPIAHEDDAERAVRSALRIVDSIEDLNETDPDLHLAIRIGINTGEAVVTLGGQPDREGLVTGDVVNTASRLEQLAPVGGVVVGEATYRATRDLFDYEQLQSVRVKGKSEPIRMWKAKAVSRYGPGVGRPSRTPFVGREDELEVLKRAYFRASRERSLQLVTIMGEPGVGKSRLVTEFFAFIDDLTDLVFWRQGRCPSYGEGITFWPLGEIVKAQAGILESDRPDEASSKLAAAIRPFVNEGSERNWLQARLAPLVGLAQPDAIGVAERPETFTAWRRFLEAMASVHTLTMIVEDLHWGDDAMVEFLEHLVDWSHDVPIVVVCTARPELYERHPRWGGGKRNSTTITLAPLQADEMVRLIASLSPDLALLPGIERVVREQAGGNPLYAEEFLAMLADREPAQKGPAQDGEGGAATEIPFPGSIQAIIAARLDTLSPQQKALLQDASVVGKVFWSGALAFMSGLDEQAVRETLHQLTRKELARPATRSSVKDQVEYAFWHILIRDVAYGQIPRLSRGRKHRGVAQWAEQVVGERASEAAELLSFHYRQALELIRTAGAADEARALAEPTRRFTVMAGDWAYGLDAARALEHYQQALELFAEGDDERGRVLAKAGEAAARAGMFAKSEHSYQEAVTQFRSDRDLRGAGDTMVKLSNLLWHQGQTARSREVLAEAIQLLEQQGPGPELANAYTEMAVHLAVLGQLKEAIELLDKALALARDLGVEELIPRALGFRGRALSELGDAEGLGDLRKALAHAEKLGLGREAARIHGMLAEIIWLTEGPASALELSRAAIELAAHRGNVDLAMALRAEILLPLFDLGEWDQLLGVADEVVRWSGERYFAVATEPYQALVHLLRGEASKGNSLAERFLPVAREIGDPQVVVTALLVGALAAQAKRHMKESIDLIEELEQRTLNHPSWYRAQHVADLARTCVAANRIDLAEQLLAGIEVHTRRHQLALLTAEAVLEEARGNHSQASNLFGDAAQGWHDFGHLLEEGHSQLGAGRCLLRMGKAEALDHLQRAQGIFRRLDARILLTETDGWLEKSAIPTS